MQIRSAANVRCPGRCHHCRFAGNRKPDLRNIFQNLNAQTLARRHKSFQMTRISDLAKFGKEDSGLKSRVQVGHMFFQTMAVQFLNTNSLTAPKFYLI